MAFSTRAAAAFSPRKSSIIWIEETIPRGQATFFPAYLGAEPWMGSNMEVWPGMDVPRRGDPHAALDHGGQISDDVSEHVVLTMTSNHSGFLTIHMQAGVDVGVIRALHPGYSAATSAKVRVQMSCGRRRWPCPPG